MEAADQVGLAEEWRQLLQPGDLDIGDPKHLSLLDPGTNEEEMAKAGHQFTREVPRIITTRKDLFDQLQQRSALLVGYRFGKPRERRRADEPERAGHVIFADLVAAEGDHLVEGRLRVAQTPRAGPRNLAQRAVADRHTLRRGDLPEPVEDLLGWDLPELELLAAREDRVRHLVQLSCRENEDNVRRWLLERLEQGIEGAGREHMHLVDHEDLEMVTRRGEGDVIDDHITHIVDPGIRGRIDLQYIHRVAGRDLEA